MSSKRLLNRIQFGKLHGTSELCKQKPKAIHNAKENQQREMRGVNVEMLPANIVCWNVLCLRETHAHWHSRRQIHQSGYANMNESRAPCAWLSCTHIVIHTYKSIVMPIYAGEHSALMVMCVCVCALDGMKWKFALNMLAMVRTHAICFTH